MIGPQVRRALVWSTKLGLDQDERHDLAELLTGHEGSWSTLSEEDAKRVADALQAYNAVQWLHQYRTDRPPLTRPAIRRTA